MGNYESSAGAANTPRDSGGLLVMLVLLYFVPSIIASRCMHHRRRAITRLNMLLGWSVLGWIAAILWALGGVRDGGSAMSNRAPATEGIGKEARTFFTN